eukprot:g13745.t1
MPCLVRSFLHLNAVTKEITGIKLKITHVSCGYAHTLFVDEKTDVWSVGCGIYGQLGHAREAKKILSSASLKSLEIVEAAISQNVFHNKHLLYRDVPDINKILEAFEQSGKPNEEEVVDNEDLSLKEDEEAESNADKPSMEWLWSFKSSVTVGRNVSDMKFNPANGDILAVAYGQYEFSLERTDFDIEGAEAKLEKAKNLYKSLTCVEFSGNAPIVVVGSADGTVGCYRVKGLDILPLSDQEQFSKIRKVVCLMR